MKPSLHRLAGIGLSLVLAALAASAWLADESTRQLVENEQWVKHTYRVLADLDSTILYGVIDPRTLEFRYVSAGHPAPIHVTGNAAAAVLDAGIGLPIGIGGEYSQLTLQLKSGDRLYLYSDGVTETMNASGELFGTPRLLTVLEQGYDRELSESVELVMRALQQWRGNVRQHDDVSLIAVEVRTSGTTARDPVVPVIRSTGTSPVRGE